MKKIVRNCVLSLTLLVGAGMVFAQSVLIEAKTNCQKHSSGCKKKQPTIAKKTYQPPKRNIPELSVPTRPLPTISTLSAKQSEMREAYMECIQKSTSENPTADVVDFVFRTQEEREGTSMRSLFLALRGSTIHHGHEICLVRAFGLRGYQSNQEIFANEGNLLVPIASPYVDVDENEIRDVYRRVARVWVRNWLASIGADMHRQFASNGQNDAARLRVTSVIRSKDEQASLVHRGLSPADCRYQFLCSSHTSASSVDLGFKNVTNAQRDWLERRLVEDQRARKIFFIRERSHFHVFVLPPMYMGEE